MWPLETHASRSSPPSAWIRRRTSLGGGTGEPRPKASSASASHATVRPDEAGDLGPGEVRRLLEEPLDCPLAGLHGEDDRLRVGT